MFSLIHRRALGLIDHRIFESEVELCRFQNEILYGKDRHKRFFIAQSAYMGGERRIEAFEEWCSHLKNAQSAPLGLFHDIRSGPWNFKLKLDADYLIVIPRQRNALTRVKKRILYSLIYGEVYESLYTRKIITITPKKIIFISELDLTEELSELSPWFREKIQILKCNECADE